MGHSVHTGDFVDMEALPERQENRAGLLALAATHCKQKAPAQVLGIDFPMPGDLLTSCYPGVRWLLCLEAHALVPKSSEFPFRSHPIKKLLRTSFFTYSKEYHQSEDCSVCCMSGRFIIYCEGNPDSTRLGLEAS